MMGTLGASGERGRYAETLLHRRSDRHPRLPRQAFSLFSQVDGWADWCSVVRHARLFGGQWRRGANLLFVADLPRLPPAPVVVRVHEYRENECIAWGWTCPWRV